MSARDTLRADLKAAMPDLYWRLNWCGTVAQATAMNGCRVIVTVLAPTAYHPQQWEVCLLGRPDKVSRRVSKPSATATATTLKAALYRCARLAKSAAKAHADAASVFATRGDKP